MTMRRRCLPPGWYPETPDACRSDIVDFVAGFTPPEGVWRGGVAPHAGWFFSGRAAARVIKTLANHRVDRVVVYGGHLSGDSEPIVYAEDSWDTPLGAQPLDSSFARELASAGEARIASRSFSDNTVEVQLPFVKHFFGDVQVIAVHSPSSERAVRLASVIHDMLTESDASAVYLGSADLTHYGPNYGFSPKGIGAGAVAWVKNENDRSLIDKALSLDASGVIEDARSRHNTCSAGPIASVMTSVARLGIKGGHLLEYYTSHDVMPNSSFVGYAAIVY